MSAAVTVYTADYCPYCTRAKILLGKKGVPFDEVNVEGRDDLRDWLVGATKQRTIPQIFVNGSAVGGYTELAQLERSGRLDVLLKEPPAASLSLPK